MKKPIFSLLTSLCFCMSALEAKEPVRPPGSPQKQEQGVELQSTAGVKTPTQILEESRGSVAVIVAAGDTSLKLGTGFFLRSSGLLLTNFHVVENTELVGVKLPDSAVLWAKTVRGLDLGHDLVVLQVDGPVVQALRLGNSDDVRVGEPIVVVSNPEGLVQTVSNGLIGGIRELDGRRLLQITAPISEGSSGGPVFNERGEVIGVVVATLSTGQNLNFAIPINYAKPLLDSPSTTALTALPKRTAANEIAKTKHHVTLRWNAPGRRGERKVVGYNVYRSEKDDGYYIVLAEKVSTLTYTDNNVQSGQTYYYKVTSIDAKGRESMAASTRATVP